MAIAATLIGPVSVGLYYIAATADSTIVANPSFVLLAGLLDGFYYGVLQWIVLRRLFRQAYWWIVVTSLSYMFFRPLFEQVGGRMLESFADPSVWGVAAFFQSSLAYSLTYWVFFAVFVGGAQWLFLRRQLDDIRLWIPAVFISQLLLLPIVIIPEPQSVQSGVLSFLETPTGLTIAGQLAKSVVAGFVVSLPTGLLLSDAIARRSRNSVL